MAHMTTPRSNHLHFFLGRGRRVRAFTEHDAGPRRTNNASCLCDHCHRWVLLSLSCSRLLLLLLLVLWVSLGASRILTDVHLRPALFVCVEIMWPSFTSHGHLVKGRGWRKRCSEGPIRCYLPLLVHRRLVVGSGTSQSCWAEKQSTSSVLSAVFSSVVF